jgi:hypothetical protein
MQKEIIYNFILGSLQNVIGAFVGFGLALYLQKWSEKKVEKKENSKAIKAKEEIISKVIKVIEEELNDISDSIDEYLKANRPIKERVQTPSWDSLIYSSIFLELFNHPEYDIFISIYSTIKRYNDKILISNDNELLKIMRECSEILKPFKK